MPIRTTAVALSLALAAPPAEDTGEIPGGYWDRGDVDREPPDGHERVITGTILVSLGAIAAVSGGVSAYITAPGNCEQFLADSDPSAEQCRSLFIFNVVHASFGGLMMISGGVILGLGLRLRKKYRAWQRRRGLGLAPLVLPRGGGASLGMRF